MQHKEMIKRDLEIFGIAYRRILPNGNIERIDPTTVEVLKNDSKQKMISVTIQVPKL